MTGRRIMPPGQRWGSARRSRALPHAPLLALALGAACVRAPAPTDSRPRPLLFTAESEPPCPPIALDEEIIAKRVVPSKPEDVNLSVFLRPRTAPPPRSRPPRIDLGKIIHPEADPARRESFDISHLDLPRELPREELPEALRGGWDEVFASRDKLRQARIQQVRASRKLAECRTTSCAIERCFAQLAADLTKRVEETESAQRSKLSQFIEDLQTFVARMEGPAKPGVTLALAYAAEERVRAGTEGSDFDAPIALYERARQTAQPGSEIAWWARYRLGLALADAGKSSRAGREFAALAAVPAAPKLRSEANYRLGELESDPDRAVAAFQAAVSLSGSDPAARQIHWAAGYRIADIELTRRRFAAALDAAAEATRAVERSSTEVVDLELFFELLTPLLAQTLGALGASEIPSPPTVPAAIVGPLGAAAADEAIQRFDVAAAVRAWQAVLTYAPDALEAPRALTGLIAAEERAGKPEAALPLRQRRARDYGPSSAWAARWREAQATARQDDARIGKAGLTLPPPLPRMPVHELDRERDLTGRVQALLTACDGWRSLDDPAEIELRVDLGPPARITAQGPKGSSGVADLAACLAARGPSYFVDAPADLKATIRFAREVSR